MKIFLTEVLKDNKMLVGPYIQAEDIKEAIEIEHEILKDEEATRKWKNLTTLRLMYMSTGCSLDLKINYDIEEERQKIPYKEAKKIFGKEGYRTAYELA